MSNTDIANLDILDDITSEELEALDPYNGISDDRKNPEIGTLKIAAPGFKVIKMKSGAVAIVVEPVLHIDDFSDTFEPSFWFVVKGAPDGMTSRQLDGNKEFVKILGGLVGIDLKTAAAEAGAMLVAAAKDGSLSEALGGAEVPVQVTRWARGLNIYPDND